MVQRVTLPLLTVIAVLLDRPTAERYGYDIARETGLSAGTVQQNLARLELEGWLESRVEDIDPRAEGRAARRMYKLTGAGVTNADKLMNEHAHRLRGANVLGRFAPRQATAGALEWLATRLGVTVRTV